MIRKAFYAGLALLMAFSCSNSSGKSASSKASVQTSAKTAAAPAAKKQPEGFVDFKAGGVKFSDYVGKGKYVLVDFWASWCAPCRGEVPNVAAVYEKYAGDDFDVLSVAVWDEVKDTKAAASELGIVWNQMVGTGTVATEAYGIRGIPQIMLFGPDGTLLRVNLRGAEIEKAVKEALGR